MLPIPSASGPPTTAECRATYFETLHNQHAFVFRLPLSATRFTVYATEPDQYEIGQTYTLTLSDADTVPLTVPADEWGFLIHCLHNAAHRWRDAITDADAAAARPRPEPAARPSYVNAEPTPAGYRLIGERFRDELARVEQLITTISAARPRDEDDDR